MIKINIDKKNKISFFRGITQYDLLYDEKLEIIDIQMEKGINTFKETEIYEIALNREKIKNTIIILGRYIKYFQADKSAEKEIKELMNFLEELKGDNNEN